VIFLFTNLTLIPVLLQLLDAYHVATWLFCTRRYTLVLVLTVYVIFSFVCGVTCNTTCNSITGKVYTIRGTWFITGLYSVFFQKKNMWECTFYYTGFVGLPRSVKHLNNKTKECNVKDVLKQ
jgi:hypothetical protein